MAEVRALRPRWLSTAAVVEVACAMPTRVVQKLAVALGWRMVTRFIPRILCMAGALLIGLAPANAQVSGSPPEVGKPDLQVMAPPTFEIGAHQVIRVRHGDYPPKARMVVRLVRAGGGADLNRYHGWTGPIHSEAVELGHSGHTTIAWDGSAIGCAPSDVRQTCPIEPGSYRLEVSIYASADVVAVPTLGGTASPPVVARGVSEPFLVAGQPDLEPLAAALRGQASQWVASLYVARGYWMGGRSDFFVNEGGPLRRDECGWRRDFHPRQPMTGIISVCAPASAVSSRGVQIRDLTLSFSDAPAWPADVINGPAAWEAALIELGASDLLAPEGVSRIEDRPESIRASHYRPDLNGWLVMVVTEGQDLAIVLVSDRGDACLSTRWGRKESSLYRLEREQFRCEQ